MITEASRLEAARTISRWLTAHLAATRRDQEGELPPYGDVVVSAEQVMRYLIQRIEKVEQA